MTQSFIEFFERIQKRPAERVAESPSETEQRAKKARNSPVPGENDHIEAVHDLTIEGEKDKRGGGACFLCLRPSVRALAE